MLKWLQTAAATPGAQSQPWTSSSSSSSSSLSLSSSSSRKRRRDKEQQNPTTTTTARVNNKKNKRYKTKETDEIKSILDVAQVPFGRGSSGYSDAFRKKPQAEREAIMDKFRPETIGFTPMTEFSKDPYPCPKPFQDYRLIVNSGANGTDNYFVHKDRHIGKKIRKPMNGGTMVSLSIDGSNGEYIMVNFLKLAMASLYPDLSMKQFSTPLFNEVTGQSCGMITVDHIDEKAQHNGTDALCNLQLMCGSHNSSKSNSENKECHIKMGKSQSYAFYLRLIKFLNGKRSGPFVELATYAEFKSTHDTAAITAFAGGTVYGGHLNAMINGKLKKVGVKGREGVFVQIHPDYVRDQEQERKDFNGKTLDRKFIDDALGPAFRAQKSAHNLLFNTNGEVYNNKGKITRGNIPTGDPFGLIRKLNGEYMHTLQFFAHNVPNMSLEEKITMKKNPKLMIAHKESNPATYVMFECTPDKNRHVDIHAKPMDPPLTYDEFMQLPVPKQKSVRVMYSNRAETLRSATYEDNNKESAESMADLENMHDQYRILKYQSANFE
jgi:hypothetical protein